MQFIVYTLWNFIILSLNNWQLSWSGRTNQVCWSHNFFFIDVSFADYTTFSLLLPVLLIQLFLSLLPVLLIQLFLSLLPILLIQLFLSLLPVLLIQLFLSLLPICSYNFFFIVASGYGMFKWYHIASPHLDSQSIASPSPRPVYKKKTHTLKFNKHASLLSHPFFHTMCLISDTK